MRDALEAVPDAVAETLGLSEQISQVVERYRYMNECVVLWRDYDYATAVDLALKLSHLLGQVIGALTFCAQQDLTQIIGRFIWRRLLVKRGPAQRIGFIPVR